MTKATRAVYVPDIGGATEVTVIEILMEQGAFVPQEGALITLESDKATMEIPAPFSGTVVSVAVSVGDRVSEGDKIGAMEVAEAETTESSESTQPLTQVNEPAAQASQEKKGVAQAPSEPSSSAGAITAGPAARRIARALNIALHTISGTGAKGRILKEDVYAHAQKALAQSGGAGVGLSVAHAPEVDFSRFGEVEVKPLTRIKRLSGGHLHRNWVTVPHVTQFGEADITDMESFRKAHKEKAEAQGGKLTLLAFIIKVVVKGLQAFPTFNASLDASATQLVYKKYFHVGVAVDTPEGLVVPVVRDVDRKGIMDLAQELKAYGEKARSKKGLSISEMQGSCFTISSLGGVGGTAFTPIVHAPDVAILGVSKAQIKPVYQGDALVPRLILPLALSYDHRVIDGAEGARFMEYLTQLLADIQTLLL